MDWAHVFANQILPHLSAPVDIDRCIPATFFKHDFTEMRLALGAQQGINWKRNYR